MDELLIAARGRLRSLAHAVRHTRDRLLHSLRRRAALEQLARRRPRSILIVCHGNICRSPYAAAQLGAMLGGAVRVQSAGFLAPGRAPPPEAISVARAFGIELSGHRSRLLTAELVWSAGLVVAMDLMQARAIRERFGRSGGDVLLLGDLDPLPIESREIVDPMDRPIEEFEACYARIDRCARALGRALMRSPTSTRVA
ncbi:MAG: hypothetical protein HY560_06990 [Gemmatimonadetes bacterium]|nr:hypothetical protein [Gemmatimonadota bacterium]